jgi:flagellar protein FliO/FliZ
MIALLSVISDIQTVPATPGTAVDFTWLFLKMLFVLGAVSVFAVLVLKYAVPRLGLMQRFQKGNYFNVIGRYVLEPRKTLYLVEVCGRYFVLGSADNGINSIVELSEKEVHGGGFSGDDSHEG